MHLALDSRGHTAKCSRPIMTQIEGEAPVAPPTVPPPLAVSVQRERESETCRARLGDLRVRVRELERDDEKTTREGGL
jgi:hypothetical protein